MDKATNRKRKKIQRGTKNRSLPKLATKEAQEVASILQRIETEKPLRGTMDLCVNDDRSIWSFSDLPLSNYTKKALKESKFEVMTEIQRATLGHSLAGRDVLAAAKTGSGKTLAFIIPLLEKLFCQRWTSKDGLGALVISPTRELALQTFEVLRAVGKNHSFSAGLVIGGKAFEDEQSRIAGMNILICTPGRLLQHMDQTPGFTCDNLQLLVLDEADRILDMGFSKTMDAIMAGLPNERQTLLFSATQTKSIRDLARLNLKEPEYISVHEEAKFSTPNNLTQRVLFCELHEKLNTLWSFIKTHINSKSLVFFSSCKQVRFVYEVFRQLRPGIPLLHLQGKMKQMKRLRVFAEFGEKKEAVLFATDLVARGLDFPKVDWVIQMDCPDDVATYIHRVGRTARYTETGQALLFLLPSEKTMLELLQNNKIPVEKIEVNPAKTQSITTKLAGLISSDSDLKFLGQKALITYLRSVFLQSNKDIFNVEKLDVAAFAKSLGLASAPKIRFIKTKKIDKNALKEHQIKEAILKEGNKEDNLDSDEEENDELVPNKQPSSRLEKLFTRKNQGVLAQSRVKLLEDTNSSDEEELLIPKNKNDSETTSEKTSNKTKRISKQEEALEDYTEDYKTHIQKIANYLKEQDPIDKETARRKRRAKRLQEKAKLATLAKGEQFGGAQLMLPEEDQEYFDEDQSSDNNQEEDDEEEDQIDDENEDEDEEEEEEEEEEKEEKKKNTPQNKKRRVLTLQEQEEEALRLLSANT